jgi:hypothetical protein
MRYVLREKLIVSMCFGVSDEYGNILKRYILQANQ